MPYMVNGRKCNTLVEAVETLREIDGADNGDVPDHPALTVYPASVDDVCVIEGCTTPASEHAPESEFKKVEQ